MVPEASTLPQSLQIRDGNGSSLQNKYDTDFCLQNIAHLIQFINCSQVLKSQVQVLNSQSQVRALEIGNASLGLEYHKSVRRCFNLLKPVKVTCSFLEQSLEIFHISAILGCSGCVFGCIIFNVTFQTVYEWSIASANKQPVTR